MLLNKAVVQSKWVAIVALKMVSLRQYSVNLEGTADAHVFGSSPNQRIEGWWSFYRRNRSTWWINYFKDLIEKDEFHPGNQLEEEALWYCFSRILQEDLDLVREHWNTHRIRNSKHDTVPGRPDEFFF